MLRAEAAPSSLFQPGCLALSPFEAADFGVFLCPAPPRRGWALALVATPRCSLASAFPPTPKLQVPVAGFPGC